MCKGSAFELQIIAWNLLYYSDQGGTCITSAILSVLVNLHIHCSSSFSGWNRHLKNYWLVPFQEVQEPENREIKGALFVWGQRLQIIPWRYTKKTNEDEIEIHDHDNGKKNNF